MYFTYSSYGQPTQFTIFCTKDGRHKIATKYVYILKVKINQC